MNFLNKLERKFGRYAIVNLPAVMIACYALGYVIDLVYPDLLSYLTLSPPEILHGQVWRIFSWVLVPPDSLDIFTVIMLYFYFSVGRTLEQTWGAFRFNVYIFSGLLFTVIGAFLLYFIGGSALSPYIYYYFSTYYINMSILLAFTATYPNAQVYLYFLIPVKMKWLGLVYGFFIAYSLVRGSWASRIAIIASLLNFVIYFLMTRKDGMNRFAPHEIKRRRTYRRSVKKMRPHGETRHRCAICGRTEKDGADLEFRFCSKCDGNYEYCQDHLFTHEHRKTGRKE